MPEPAPRLLLVDPDPAFRFAAEGALRAAGFEVQSVQAAPQALQLMRTSAFDLIVTALEMPGASGVDLLRFLQLEKPETGVMLTASTPTVDAAVEAMQLGAIDFVLKPIDPGALAARVAKCLDRRKLLLETRHFQVYLERTFRRYISPEVLTVLMSTREIDELQARQLEGTVMFCDLRDFTKLSRTIAPETLLPMLNTCYFEPAVDIISAHRGTVDKFIGDGVMAVFGAPLHVEDHAKQALKAALDLERELESTRQAGKHPFRIGIGISSGMVISGNLGGSKRLDFTVFGPIVNLAARLEKLAGQGEILLDEATFKLVSPMTLPVRQTRAEIKGEGNDLVLYRLSTLRQEPPKPGTPVS